jgi:hypothetical protein
MDGVSSAFGVGGYGMGGGGGGVVSIEAAFAVGEYDVVVLSARESSGLEDWLRAEGYRVPEGASEALRPYVQQGFRFFAARVNAERVRFEDGRALLSPLRIRYESEQLMLPVRLGMLSSPGTQDLIVYVISRDGRYEVANRDNVFVPTNLEVRPAVRGRFAAFYDALLERVWDRHPGSVITEYAWEATSCDPCPGPTMSAEDVTTLGGDVATGAVRQTSPAGVYFGPVERMFGPRIDPGDVRRLVRERYRDVVECVESPIAFEAVLGIRDGEVVDARVEPEPRSETGRCIASALRGLPGVFAGDAPMTRVRFRMNVQRHVTYVQRSARGFTVTRLRYRYDEGSPATDLVFRRASPVRGGLGTPDEGGRMPTEVRAARTSTFQARYAILHRRSQRIRGCRNVAPGGWGGPPHGEERTRAARALDAVRAHRRVRLERLIRTPVPDLGIRASAAAPISPASPPWTPFVPRDRPARAPRVALAERRARSSVPLGGAWAGSRSPLPL